MDIKRVVACIKRHRRFLITSHTGLEGDALGSELAFYRLLKKIGKDATIINEDSLPGGYDFLPDAGRIKRYHDSLRGLSYDCFSVLDCSELSRCGKVARLYAPGKTLLNIDHHISNSRFAEVNWVEPAASSVAEMMYRLFKEMGRAVDRDTALVLYVGLVTDTGSFRYSNTTSVTHRVASELMRHNLDTAYIYRRTYEDIPFQYIKLIGRYLARVRRDRSGRIAWLSVRSDDFEGAGASFDWTDYLLGVMRSVKGVEVALLFRSHPQQRQIRVNLRSQGKVDVNRIARAFKGGGHKTASGCTIEAGTQEAIRRVLQETRDNL